MKESIFSIAVAAVFLAATVFTSTACQSSAKKADNAADKVIDAKADLKSAENAAMVAKQKAADEWKIFKFESENKIAENDRSIAELRERMKTSGKKMTAEYAKGIDNLEAKSKGLRNRIDTYDTAQSDWEAFKREFNHDMDEFGAAFKDLTVNNKK